MSWIPGQQKIIIRLPTPHPVQRVFLDWSEQYPNAQCLIAPAGVKVGKTFGASIWLLTEALTYPGSYCVWIAPTYLKSRIGYRYIKAMIPDIDGFKPIDGRLEIKLPNGSFIKFLHGRDAETTVEGEAIDRFVIDESGKIQRQVFNSTLTTITQTKGKGICTGTPRGFTWYYDMFKKAQGGDPFFVWAQLQTNQSPYVQDSAIDIARRLLPPNLFAQYYLAQFTSVGSTFGDLSKVWDESIKLSPGIMRHWVHPNAELRSGEIIHGVDLGRQKDFTVFYSVNQFGQLVGYARFRGIAYNIQVMRLKNYLSIYFPTPKCENSVEVDATGVGLAVVDMLMEAELDANINPVTFTQKSKSTMVTRTIMAIESGWHKAPRIPEIEHEFSSYEVSVTKTGLHSYSAPDGEHDDIVSSAIMAISKAFQSNTSESTDRMIENAMNGKIDENQSDIIAAYANVAANDDFFDQENETDSIDEFDININEV